MSAELSFGRTTINISKGLLRRLKERAERRGETYEKYLIFLTDIEDNILSRLGNDGYNPLTDLMYLLNYVADHPEFYRHDERIKKIVKMWRG
jgi:hypothetical protein